MTIDPSPHDDLAECRAETERYRILAESASDVVMRLSMQGLIEWVSPSVRNLLGWRPQELLGRNGAELVHPQDLPLLREMQGRVSGGGREQFRFRARTAAGDFRWMWAAARPVPGPDGSTIARIVAWRDIDALVRAENALRLSEHRYRLLAENASGVVILIASDGRITWVSEGVTPALGWFPAELLGDRLAALVHDEDLALFDESMPDSTGRDEPPVRVRTRLGQFRWMSVHRARVVDGATGSVPVDATVIGMNDVTGVVEARRHMDAIQDTMIDPHVVLRAVRDRDGDIVDFTFTDANQAACEYYRLSHDDLIGSRVLARVPNSEGRELVASCAAVVESGVPLCVDDMRYEQLLHQGGWRRQDVRVVKLEDGVSYTWRDVTERYETMRALTLAEEKYRLLAEGASDVVVRLRGGLIEWVSPSLERTLGWTADDWIGTPLAEHLAPEDLAAWQDAVVRMADGESVLSRWRVRSREGLHHWVEAHGSEMTGSEGPEGVLVSFHIIDTEVAAQHALERQARHDDLTGLLNRTTVLERLGSILGHPPRTGQRTAIGFCDIDDFKSVNDNFGHAAGDQALRVLADRIHTLVRDGDLVARFGGDEILVVLDRVHDIGDAVDLAETFRAAARAPIPTDDGDLMVTISVGVTLADEQESVDSLVARADSAMYEAKAHGKDRVVAFADSWPGERARGVESA